MSARDPVKLSVSDVFPPQKHSLADLILLITRQITRSGGKNILVLQLLSVPRPGEGTKDDVIVLVVQ